MSQLMKRIYPYLLLLLTGLSVGVFCYVGQFPAMRFYAHTQIPLFGNLRLLPVFLGQLALAVAGLAAVWLGYSVWLSKWTGKPLPAVLRIDALSYLPLGLAGLVAIPGPPKIIAQAATLLQLGSQVFLLVMLAGVVYLKVRHYGILAAGRRRHGRTGWSDNHLRPTWKQATAIFLASLCLYLMVGLRLFERLPLGGDEPHYLLITHSLLHDRDLAIMNNYQQGDYHAFFPGELKSHVSLGKDQTRYPGHPIGLSVLLLPFYAVGGRVGALLLINLIAALLVTQLYLLAFAVTQSRKLALLLWALSSFSAPLWIYSAQIYPEVPSACLLAIAFRLILYPGSHPLPLKGRPDEGRFTRTQTVCIGLTLGLLPWIQQRMILPATLLMCVYIIRSGIFARRVTLKFRPGSWFRLIPVFVFAIFGLGLAGYHYALYGNPMPDAPYRSIGMSTIFSWNIFFEEGMLGLWLDQEAGLFMAAPHYVLIVPGFILLLRRNWREALGIALLISSIYIACGGFVLKWYGAWSPAARYMVALTPLLLPLVGEALLRLRSPGFRVATTFLIALSAWWSYIFFRIPVRSLMQGIGINGVLEYYRTPLVDASLYFPSFILRSNRQYAVAAVWTLLILSFAAWYVRAARRAMPGTSEGLTRFGSLTGIRKLAGIYGAGLLTLLLLTWMTTHLPAHERAMNAAKNRHVREFLRHPERTAVLAGVAPVVDPTVQFEYVSRPKRGVVERHDPHALVSGPREFFPKGRYTATFVISAGDAAIAESVATIDVVAGRGKRVFVAKTLRGHEFVQANTPVEFRVPFELPEDVNDLETRVFFLDRTDVQVDAITIRPDFVDVYYRAGLQKLWQGDQKAALAIFADAASAGGLPHARLLYQLGVLAQQRGQWERSVTFLRRALNAAPDFADTHYRLGLAMQQTGNWQLASDSFEQATQLSPTHSDAWNALVTTYEYLQLPQLPPEVSAAADRLRAWQIPYAVNFANQIEFLGYRAEVVDVSTLRIHYYWKALTPMLDDYVIFVHFADKGLAFQQDHEPQRWISEEEQYAHPTSRWQVGEIIHEQFDFPAPSGTFTVTLGVWDPQGSGKRLPIVTPVALSEYLRRQIRLQEQIVIP